MVNDAAYLHQRTGGMIGSLDQLIHEGVPVATAKNPTDIPLTCDYTGNTRWEAEQFPACIYQRMITVRRTRR